MLILSIVISIFVTPIAIVVSRSKYGKFERLLVWYAILGAIALLSPFIVCGIQEPGNTSFLMCTKGIAPWLTLLAAHSAILLLLTSHRGNEEITLPFWAELLGSLLILAAAFIFLLPEYELLALPAIAVVTVPLMTIIHKYSQQDNNEESCDSYQ